MSNTFLRLALTTCLATLASPIAASEPVLPPVAPALAAKKPVDVLPSDASAFVFADSINPADKPGSFTIVGERGGKPVYRAVNPKGAVNHYGINVTWKSARPIRKGDAMLARFAARAISARQESGEAEGMFTVAAQGADNNAVQTFSVGPDWTFINVPFVADRDYATGEVTARINFGQLEQTFEITGLELLNFEGRAAQKDLPITVFSYAGREADAAWRKAALARIQDLRTAPLAIRVVDAGGRPVAGAKVAATMTRSDFLWGTSVSAEHIVEKSADADRYRRAIVDLFDVTVIENAFKWPRWAQSDYRARGLQALDWLTAQGKPVKGHNLAWPGWKWTPGFIAKDPQRCEKIAQLQDAHIKDITTVLKGRLIGWDVVNEPVHETDYWKCMPRETVAEWFKLAERSDPKLQLTLNEYAMLNRSSSPLMIADMLEFSRMLKKNGARVDVLGVQGHVGQTPRPPAAVLSDLDLLAVDGQQIQITEYDFNTRDDALQADYTRDFLIALYSHKAVTGFIQWGFWESAHWKPAAAMFRPDWSEKPNLKVWRDLVLGAWRTRVDAPTGADGSVSARAHLGSYKVSVTARGKTQVAEYRLAKGASPLVVRLR